MVAWRNYQGLSRCEKYHAEARVGANRAILADTGCTDGTRYLPNTCQSVNTPRPYARTPPPADNARQFSLCKRSFRSSASPSDRRVSTTRYEGGTTVKIPRSIKRRLGEFRGLKKSDIAGFWCGWWHSARASFGPVTKKISRLVCKNYMGTQGDYWPDGLIALRTNSVERQSCIDGEISWD
jgi:hypothetical protein